MLRYIIEPHRTPIPKTDYYCYTGVAYSRATGESAYASIQTSGGNLLSVYSNKIKETSNIATHIFAIIHAIRQIPVGKSVTVHTINMETVERLETGSCHPDLLALIREASQDKQVYVEPIERNSLAPFRRMAFNIAKDTLYGVSEATAEGGCQDKILTAQEYAFFKGLENLLRNFATDLDGATFTIKGEDFDFPRCASGDDLIKRAVEIKLLHLYPRPKFNIGDPVQIVGLSFDVQPGFKKNLRTGIISNIVETTPRLSTYSRFAYELRSEDDTPAITINEIHLKSPDPQ